MEVDAVVGAAEGALDQTGAGKASNIASLEVDPVDLDEEVGDLARVLFKSIWALLLDMILVAVAFELRESGSHSFKSGVGGGKSHLLGGEGLLVVALHALKAELGVVGLVKGHLGNFLRQTEGHFLG